MYGCIEMDSEGRGGGGLALMWRDHMEIQLINFSLLHIHSWVHNSEEPQWVFIGMNGHPEVAKRSESWQLLERLRPNDAVPQLVGGDFNEIVSLVKKSGGKQRLKFQMDRFKTMLNIFSLQDLGFVGNMFMWCNGHEGSHCISECLDCFVANKEWQDLITSWQIHHRGVA